jgi:uncharacterized protein
MNNADYWIEKLQLEEHIEGGYFKETFRSQSLVKLQTKYGSEEITRAASTCIYFLLKSGQSSKFHRLTSEEIWHFYLGSPIEIYIINDSAELIKIRLGNNPELCEVLHFVIPKGCWFAAEPIEENSFSLISCFVAPGFEYQDFELGDYDKLAQSYPKYKDLIKKLT